jgi:phospholipid transport system substrate-binding protein
MRNLTKQYAILGIFTILLGLMPETKGVAGELQPPEQVIQNVSETLQKKLQDKVFTKDFLQVTQFVNGVIEPHTDFNKIAPLVLGKHWKAATPEEQQRFKQEFQTLLIRAYSRAFVEYSEWKISFMPLEISDEATKAIVKTKVLQPGRQPINVDYRMFLSNDEWKVYDIMIDGVSLVTNYRSTFNDEIQNKGSISAVIDWLAKKNAEALLPKKS